MTRVRDQLRRPAVWLVPIVVGAIQLVGTAGAHRRPGPPPWAATPPNWFGYLLLLAGPLALLFRTLYPYLVLLAVLGITLAYQLAGFGHRPVFLALLVAFVTAAAVGPRWRTYPLPVVGWLAIVWLVPLIRGVPPPPTEVAAAIGAWLIVLVAIAEGIRQRRSVLEARRQRRAAEAAEAHAEQQRRATQTRLSIARELHDVLAHSLSMINVQSAVALELLDSQPERLRPALSAIKDASKQAITDVHALVDALRTDNGRAANPTAPTPGIGELDTLVAAARGTGLTVDTHVSGTPGVLPAVIDLAAARIVQESLTNVVRHSRATRASVSVAYEADELVVQVDDDGPPVNSGPGTGGSGIDGMRERARALGGRLEAQRRPGGGFRVRATFPLHRESAGVPS